jgi:branched-chain amino acid transport system permease protein
VGKILENLVTGLSLGSLYALVSIGMTMVYGLVKIIHVAHAGVYVLGAFLGYITYVLTGNIWLAFPVAMAGCALIGYLMYVRIYRVVQDAKVFIPLIISIGMFTAMGDVFRLIAGPYSLSFRHQFTFLEIQLGDFQITPHQLLVIGSAVLLLGISWWVVNKTKTGMAWKASAQDREVAMGLGVKVNYYFALSFMFGSALAGAAGVLVGLYYVLVNPNMGDVWAYKIFVVMVLGGLGNVLGTVIASYFLGLTESFIIAYFGYFLPRDSIAFILMILILIFAPFGIMGRRQRTS